MYRRPRTRTLGRNAFDRGLDRALPLLAILAVAALFAVVLFGGRGFAQVAGDGFAFGNGAGPATSLRDIFTDQVIVAGLFLVTAPLTSLLKRYTGTHDRATQVMNALVNALLKGLLPLVAGIVTWPIALALVVAGLIADQSWYALLVQTSAKGVRVEEPVVSRPIAPPPSS